jgi:hypothetical protein
MEARRDVRMRLRIYREGEEKCEKNKKGGKRNIEKAKV